MSEKSISAEDNYVRQRVITRDAEMAYVDTGSGRPCVFIHGNPTSSYIWRNIIPHIESKSRCIAPDLIGMGDSSRSPRNCYRLFEQAAFLDAFFDALNLDDVCLVLQDWGVVLGVDWARRHPDRVRGIVHMEGIMRTMTWPEWASETRDFVRALKSDAGEKLILEENQIVEGFLVLGIAREISEVEMERYRAPYRDSQESRQPTLDLSREIPLEGIPPDSCAMIDANAQWLRGTTVLPKLFINGNPGLNITGSVRDYVRTFPNQQEITVDGIHFLQEDSPHAIGAAVKTFVNAL
ncbi:MAG TPA: haloalkane dehalogenase [Gammaproteobacteria bacterium]|nr:haloalkane dehalogenase [Gammaproteobacteria bacterium]|tara:strand:- start:671 stop:1552 length:882 start_codon:yes stop_codon:yes gene_type:complete